MILRLKDIHISFTNAHNETFDLLRGVNLDVEKGKITALIGGNGTGKTTLFNIISGFEKNFKGKIEFEGHEVNFKRMPAHKISMEGIGRLFQDGQLMSGLTLMENMKLASNDTTGEIPFTSLLFPNRYKKAELKKEAQAREILTRIFGEGNKYLSLLNQDASAFSYGEQRLLSLARMLMGGDRLLLLDEPTSGVHPQYINTIAQIIREMKETEGLTVLLIEHNMHFVREVADTCAYLDEGVIAEVGPTNVVLGNQKVRNSYLGL